MTIRQVKLFGHPTWQNTKMDNLRKTECMCVNCIEQPHCEINKAVAGLTQQMSIGICVTHCPKWKSQGP